jgi:hypothetical protein
MGIEELINKHGTLEEFSSAVWAASDDLFCTPEEAIAAIEKYKQELAQSAPVDA